MVYDLYSVFRQIILNEGQNHYHLSALLQLLGCLLSDLTMKTTNFSHIFTMHIHMSRCQTLDGKFLFIFIFIWK